MSQSHDEMLEFLEDIQKRFYTTLTDDQRHYDDFMQDYYRDTEDIKKIIAKKIAELKSDNCALTKMKKLTDKLSQ